MNQQYRHYELGIPITQEELYEMVGKTTISELKTAGFRYEGTEPFTNALKLSLVDHVGNFLIAHPSDEKASIVIYYPGIPSKATPTSNRLYKYVEKRLESLLKVPIMEVQPAELVSA